MVGHERYTGPVVINCHGSDWSGTVTKLASEATVGPARHRYRYPP